MTVFENVAFGLRVRPRRERPAGSEIKTAVKDLLQLVELDALGARYPSELSGGQQQRVALARALAVQPRVLLLDEPFGALDARVRKQLRQWLRQLHDEVKVTTILVTHDSEEACEVADRVAVMHEARIAQSCRCRSTRLPWPTPTLLVAHSPTPSKVRTAALSNGDGKNALAAWLSWCSVNQRSFGIFVPMRCMTALDLVGDPQLLRVHVGIAAENDRMPFGPTRRYVLSSRTNVVIGLS